MKYSLLSEAAGLAKRSISTPAALLLFISLAAGGLSGCDIGMILLNAIVYPVSQFDTWPKRLSDCRRVGIVVPPYFLHAPTAETGQIDPLLNRLGEETIRFAHTRAAVSLIPLHSGEVVESILSKRLNCVMELQVSVGTTGTEPFVESEQPANHAIMRARVFMSATTVIYDRNFDCIRPYSVENAGTDGEDFWALMIQCPESLAKKIVDAVF